MRLVTAWPVVAVLAVAGALLPATHAVRATTGSASPRAEKNTDAKKRPPNNPHPPMVCPGTGAGADAPTANASAVDAAGVQLPNDPTISTQQTIVATVTGFRPGGDVKVWLANSPASAHYAADTRGALTYSYAAAALRFGSYRLLFQGDPPSSGSGSGNVSVLVPTIGEYPFLVGCANKVKPHVVRLSKIVLKAMPTKAIAGKPVTLTGYAATGNTKLHVPLQLWASVAHGTWKEVATKFPAAKGALKGVAAFTVTPGYTSRYQLRYAGGTTNGTAYAAKQSKVIGVTVIARVNIWAPKSFTHRMPKKVRIYAATKLSGRVVYLQVDGKTTLEVRTNANGEVVFDLTLNQPGTHTLRAYVPTTRRNYKRYSRTLTVTVS